MMRIFMVMRLVAAFVVALGLSVAAGSPSAAQDDEENGRTAAQEVRELVLKQRERVLAHVASIMAGDEESTKSAETDGDEAVEDGEADDGEADDEGEDEGDDGEGEDEGEDGEGEDEGEDEGDEEDEGVGGEDCELAPSVAVGGEEDGDAVASEEAEDETSADEAGADEEENGESVSAEVEDAQPAGGVTDTAGDQEICSLPSTGTGSSDDMHNVLSAFAVLAAVAAAGFSLRQRFI